MPINHQNNPLNTDTMRPRGNGLILFLSFICLVIGYMASSGAYQSFFNGTPSESKPPYPIEFYSVVFDAGSTGTRVFVFQFKLEEDEQKGSVIKLSQEYFLSNEPGISSFANKISEVITRLKPLLEYALNHVPGKQRNITLLSFKATAGLRLLPKEVGTKILDEVRFLMKGSSFHIPDLKKIEVMEGDDEGLFGWVTANFLLGTLWSTKKENTAAAIDLGGGSVQITFALPSTTQFKPLCSLELGKVYAMNVLKSKFNVFTYSALGNGLKSAYLYIMGGQEEIENSGDDELDKQFHLSSPCFTKHFESTWQHGRYTYTIMGEEPEISQLEDCQSHVKEFVKSSRLSPVVRLETQDIYLFSYFFDVAQWTGIIPASETSMVLTPSDFLVAAKYYCNDENFSEDEPFLCMSLLYIHSLLTVGLELPEDRSLYVVSEINGRRLSWTLGSALSLLRGQFNYSNLCNTL